MTAPAELASLPARWDVTSDQERRTADPAGALPALDRSLAVLPDLREPALDELPADLIEYFDFTAQWLAEAMPTLSSVSVETIEKLLASQQAPVSTAAALAEYWLVYITAGIARSALTVAASQPDSAARFLAIVERELPRQSVDMASTLLTQAAVVDRSLVERAAGNEKLDPELRRHATSLLAWLGDRRPQ